MRLNQNYYTVFHKFNLIRRLIELNTTPKIIINHKTKKVKKFYRVLLLRIEAEKEEKRQKLSKIRLEREAKLEKENLKKNELHKNSENLKIGSVVNY